MANYILIKAGEKIDRLDKFLIEQEEIKAREITRNKIQKMISEAEILVNGKQSKINYTVKTGDEIKLDFSGSSRKRKQKESKAALDYGLDEILVDKQRDFIVVNKKSGILSHGTETLNEYTLADLVLSNFPKVNKVGDDLSRPGIVHRLDRDVSGLMVIALNQKSFESLKEQFKERSVIKKYTALVYGELKQKEGEINFPITRSSRGYKMAAVPETYKGEASVQGRNAITKYKVIEKYINYTLLEVEIKTGRTHQIRVHMNALNHPVVGDNTYTTKRYKEQNEKLDLGRIFLVSTYLEFKDLSGETHKYQIEIPQKLKDVLKIIK